MPSYMPIAVVRGHRQHIAYKHTPCAHITAVLRQRHASSQAALPSTEREDEEKKKKKNSRVWINSLPIYGLKEVLRLHSSKKCNFFPLLWWALWKNEHKPDGHVNRKSRYGHVKAASPNCSIILIVLHCLHVLVLSLSLRLTCPPFYPLLLLSVIQMGANIKVFLRLVEDFVSMLGMKMSGFQDIYEVTENLGEPYFPPASCSPLTSSWDDLSFLRHRECINLNLSPHKRQQNASLCQAVLLYHSSQPCAASKCIWHTPCMINSSQTVRITVNFTHWITLTATCATVSAQLEWHSHRT